MTQGKPWLYYLVSPGGATWRKENGMVVAKTDYKPLRNTPKGWQDIQIGWQRDFNLYGTNRNFSLPFEFVLEGLDILKYLKYSPGRNIEQVIYLLIQQERLFIDSTNYYFWYKYFYRGELDFSTAVYEENKFSISISEGGLWKLFNANRATVYDIPFDNDAVNVKMDGMFIQNKGNMLITDGTLEIDNGQHTLEGTIISDESLGSNGVISPVRRHFTDSADLFANNTPFLVTGNYISSPIVKFKIGFTVVLADGITPDPSAGGQILIRVFDASGNVTGFYSLAVYGGASNLYQHQTVEGTVTLTNVPANSLLFLANFLTIDGLIASGSGADEVVFWNYDNAEGDVFEITYPFRQATSYCKAYKRKDLFRKLVAKITGDADFAGSALLDAYPNPLVTSGDAIRGVPTAVIKTSLNDFFQDCNVQRMAGIGVENKLIIIEERAHFFDINPLGGVFVLGNIKNWKHSDPVDILFNSIKIGYPDVESQDVNGKYAFNTTVVWTSPMKRIVKEFDLTTKYKADPFEIEIKRSNFAGKDTTDDFNDNDVCLLDAVPSSNQTLDTVVSFSQSLNAIIIQSNVNVFVGQTIRFTGSALGNDNDYTILEVAILLGLAKIITVNVPIVADENNVTVTLTFLTGLVYDLRRVAYSAMEGVPDPSTVFNVEISPKRLLMKHFQWLRGMFYGFDGEKLIYATEQRNHDLKTTLGTQVIDEDAEVAIESMGGALFKPLLFEFEPEFPGDDLVDRMEVSPNGCFGFVHPVNGKSYSGFNTTIGIAPNTKKEQAFVLLSSPQNNLNDFAQ